MIVLSMCVPGLMYILSVCVCRQWTPPWCRQHHHPHRNSTYVHMYAPQVTNMVSWSIWASRMKLRSPTLPEDLEVLWDYFIDNVPDWLWRKHTRKDMGGTIISNNLGIALLNDIKNIQRDLGEHFKPNPLNPPKKKPRIAGGDAMAFTNWIHKVVQANKGRVSM